jgi:hypothetical protein
MRVEAAEESLRVDSRGTLGWAPGLIYDGIRKPTPG